MLINIVKKKERSKMARRKKGDYVFATHPMNKNFDERSRGRCMHIFKDKNHTMCNMFPTEKVTSESGIRYNKRCKICFKGDYDG